MHGNRRCLCMLHHIHCCKYRIACCITLWCTCHISNCLWQNDLCLRHSHTLYRLRRRCSNHKCHWICISDILGCKNHNTSCNKLHILTCIKHPCQIINRCIWIGTSHTLDKGRNRIIVVISRFVIGNHSFLNTLTRHIQGNVYDSILTSLRG